MSFIIFAEAVIKITDSTANKTSTCQEKFEDREAAIRMDKPAIKTFNGRESWKILYNIEFNYFHQS